MLVAFTGKVLKIRDTDCISNFCIAIMKKCVGKSQAFLHGGPVPSVDCLLGYEVKLHHLEM